MAALDPTGTTIAVEVTKALISGYLTYAKQKGLTEEALDKCYKEAKAEFEKNDPAQLPDA